MAKATSGHSSSKSAKVMAIVAILVAEPVAIFVIVLLGGKCSQASQH